VSNGVQNNGVRGVNDLDGLTVHTEPLIPIIDSGKFTIAVRRITPEDAATLLELRNNRNRGLRKRDAANQARDVKSGNWEINGETVKTDWYGMLIDGQHRLEACVRAGVPIDTIVVTGLSPEAQQTVDIGTRRTNGDRLALKGEVNANVLAAIARRVWAWDEGDRSFSSNSAPTPHEMDLIIERYPDLREATRLASDVYTHVPGIPKPVIGATYHVLSAIDEDTARLFFLKLKTGAGMHVGHPILTLRERINRSHGSKDPSKKITQFSHWVDYVFRAWNAFVTGRDLTRIQQGRDKRVVMPVGLKNTSFQDLAEQNGAEVA
jgi:hypothetical protein